MTLDTHLSVINSL